VSKDSFKVVVVGLGFGQLHCELIQKTAGLELSGVCDSDPQRLSSVAKRFKIQAFSSLKEVLADPQIKLVVFATPHSEHKAMAIAAMNAKKNVIVEKIMCLNTKEADAMLQARDRNKVMLSVHQNRRFDRDFRTLQGVLEKGVLGKVFLIEERIHFYGEWHGWRRERKFGGGLINDWGAHLVDQLLVLNPGQKVKSVFATFKYKVFKTDVENHASARLQFSNGNEGLAEVGQLSGMRLPRWYVVGEKGSMLLDETKWASEDQQRFEMHTRLGNQDLKSQIGLIQSGWHLYYENISEHLSRKAKLAVRPEETRRVVAVIQAAHESARSGRSIRVE